MKLQLTESELIKLISRIAEQVEDDNARLLDVPHYLQSDDSTCGPASLRMVMAYYGLQVSEEDLAAACGHTYELGCRSEDMACAAQGMGFDVHLKNNSTVEELSRLVNAGAPVIVDWFCGDPPEGHSSVVIGVSDKNIYILDPFLEEMRVVAKEDFRRCWFDFYETPITPNNLYVGQIMVLRPKKNFSSESNKEETDSQIDESKKDYFSDSEFGDEDGKNKYKVSEVYDFVKKNKSKYLKKNFDIDKIKHNLEWWNKLYDIKNKDHKERMMNADTSFPLLVLIEKDGNLSVADGLNRLYKAIKIEKRKTLPVFLVDKKDLEPLKKTTTNESELKERCWKGYTQKGMKTMFGKKYPNCVKKKSRSLKEYLDPIYYIKNKFIEDPEGVRPEEFKKYEAETQKLVDIIFKFTQKTEKLPHLNGFKLLKLTPEYDGWTVLLAPTVDSWFNWKKNEKFLVKLDDYFDLFKEFGRNTGIQSSVEGFYPKLNFHLWKR